MWAKTETGALMPLDPEILPEPAVKLVARNPATGRCRVLAAVDVDVARGWRGVVFHESHWATCPSASRHRQDRLL